MSWIRSYELEKDGIVEWKLYDDPFLYLSLSAPVRRSRPIFYLYEISERGEKNSGYYEIYKSFGDYSTPRDLRRALGIIGVNPPRSFRKLWREIKARHQIEVLRT